MMRRCVYALLVTLCLSGLAHGAIGVRGATQASAASQVGVTPSFVASASASSGAAVSNSITVARPTGTAAGHVLIGHLVLKGTVTSGTTPPPGWTLLDLRVTTGANPLTQMVYWRVASAGEPASYTWTWPINVRVAAAIIAVSNAEPINPFDVWAANTAVNNATINLPILTTTSANTLLVALLGSSRGSSHDTPTGMTERYDLNALPTGQPANGITASGATQLQAAPGSTGSKSATIAGGAADNVAHLLALRPRGALTLAVPAGTVAGDVMVASVAYRPCSNTSGGACSTTITPPSGWTLVRAVNTTTGAGTAGYGSRLLIYYRVATAAEPASYVWYFGGTPVHAGAVGGIVSFSGVDTANPIVAEEGQVTASSSTHTAPSVNTGTVAGGMLVTSHAVNSSGTWTPPAGMTERIDIASMPTPNALGIALEVNTQLLATAGATGTRSAVLSNPPAGDTGGTHTLVLRPAPSGFDHIRIEHTGRGVTCQASSITLKACADAACTTLYVNPVTVSLLPAAGWTANPVTFTGSTTVGLAVTTPSTVILGTSAATPAPSGTSPQCFDGATPSCSHTFADTGFIFSAIPTQTAGVTTAGHTLQAVRKADNSTACTGLFSGNVALELAAQCVNPTTCAGVPVTINGNAIASNPASGVSSYATVTLNFGANSTAPFQLGYADVGAIKLHARYGLAGGGSMVGESNTFVVKPFGFTVTNIVRTADNFPNPAAADASGPAFIKAGEAFSATVTAIAQGGTPTPNYAREIVPEGVLLSANLVAPAGGNNPALANALIVGGEFGAGGMVNDPAGVATVNNLAWGEVGILSLTPAVGDGDYLGAGNVTGTPSGNVGRFYPHHFSATNGGLNHRVSAGCVPASTFTYLGEPLALNFDLVAQNAANATTQNYAGAFAKLDLATPAKWLAFGLADSLGLGAVNGSTPLTPRLAVNGASGSFLGGLASTSATVVVNRGSSVDGPFTAATFGIAPQDQDGVTLLSGALDLDADLISGNERRALANGALRYGRVRLANAYGSELLALPVPVSVQYFNGLGFVANVDDSCTAFNFPADLTLSNYLGNLNPGETTPSFAPNPVSAGSATLTLSAPLSGNSGSVDLILDVPGWLEFNWSGTVGDPRARATFGVHRKAGEFIYQRENH